MFATVFKAVTGTLQLKLIKRKMLATRKKSLADFLSSGKKIVFPRPHNPNCTIIIPTYNGAEHTLVCLLSLLPHAGDWMEILVHDDCSSDQTLELLARFENLRIVRASKNIGFLRSVNNAVGHSRGKYIILMNNDAVFVEGSILQAIAQFENDPACGYVGVRVLLANKRLQEAGCIVFQSGQTHGHLRFSRADDLRALYLREVDYCSAVFCIFKAAQFRKMGGFDLAFAPAYFEETDFCMRLRRDGLRCYFNPAILVEHFEFGSQPSTSARQAMADRRKIFLGRWKKVMELEGYSKSLFNSNTETSALRLQQHPRKLLVVQKDTNEKQIADYCHEQNGFTTIHFVGLSEIETRTKLGQFGPRVELSCSKEMAGVKKILRKRKNYFDIVDYI